jgi:glycosyltransferase involved in cell wall biosynthesis
LLSCHNDFTLHLCYSVKIKKDKTNCAMMTPKISVIIPVFNNDDTIERALLSVKSQTCPIHEVLICDDGSVDRTLEICQSFSKKLPLKIIPSAQQTGAAAARNRGIVKASGDLIAFLDADDEWRPQKLKLQVQKFLNDPEVTFVSSFADFYTYDGRYIHQIHPNRKPVEGGDTWKTFLQYNFICTPTVIAKRESLLKVSGFNEQLPVAEDLDLWIKLACDGKLAFVFETLVNVYNRPNSLIKSFGSGEIDYTLPMILRHIAANKNRLSSIEINRILGARYSQFGRNQYYQESALKGLLLMVKAVQYDLIYLKNVYFILRFSALGQWLKNKLSTETHEYDSCINLEKEMSEVELLVTVDVEEEFDWSAPFSCHKPQTESMKHFHLAHDIMTKHGFKAIYLLDYPILEDPFAVSLFKKWLKAGQCEIGVQLHPWVTPPYEEELNRYNSFAGNLPFKLEYQKLQNLRDRIYQEFGVSPKYYKAGRYGFGKNTAKILKSLGFEVDLSFVPHTSFKSEGGPDYRDVPDYAFWLDEHKTLKEIPLTKNFTGLLSSIGRYLYPVIDHPGFKKLRLPGIFARLGLLNRVNLSPEGSSLQECIDLVKTRLRKGQKIFVYSFHSSSLMLGGNPYVKSQEDLNAFLQHLDGFYAFFSSQCQKECLINQPTVCSAEPEA